MFWSVYSKRRVLGWVAIAVLALVGLIASLASWPAPAGGGISRSPLPAGTGRAGIPRSPLPAETGRLAASVSPGYWLVGADGGVFSFGAPFYGSTGGLVLNQPVVGMAGSPDGGGYWLVAKDGGVFAFGDAPFQGSTGAVRLNAPIAGMALDPATGGYWLVAADGGVFSFDAPFYGSTGGLVLNQPIVGMAATPDGGGYWLVARDGGVFAFGDARFDGSTGGVRLNSPIVGMAADPATGGYWLVAADGGIFSFGAPFYGSTGGLPLTGPVVGMSASGDGHGYWLVGSDGGIFTFGDATFEGSTGGMALRSPVVGAAPDQRPPSPPGQQTPSPPIPPPTTVPTTTAPGGGGGFSFATSVSSNRRYLLDQHGNPYLVNGDTPWTLAWGLDPTQQATYLANRQANGFNSVMVDLVGNSNMHGNANGANWNGDVPLTGGNVTTPNPAYWSKIDAFINLAGTYGITVWALPVDAYAVATPGNVFSSLSTSDATSFGTFLGNRYRSFPNLVWMIGNDWDADGPSGSLQNATPSPGIYTAMLSAITAAGDTHLSTSELGYYESDSSDGSVTWPDMTIQGVYSYHPTYEAVLRGRAATPTKPAVVVETVYDHATTGAKGSPLDLRKTFLWPLTSGASGQFYGNDLLWPEMVPGNSSWLGNMNTAAVTTRKTMFPIIAALNWQDLQPDTSNQFVTGGRGTAWTAGPGAGAITPYTDDGTYGNYVTAAYTPDGSLGVIYNPSGATLTLSAAKLGPNPTITRVDPTNGAETSLGWTTSLASPGDNAGGDPDWFYIVRA